jgi:UrcA family protein
MTLQTTSLCRLVITGALFSLLSAAAYSQAFAAQPVNEKSGVTVKYADLNLNTDAGTRELLDRLSKAADHVCHKAGWNSALDDYGFYRCYRRTLAAAVDKVHHSQLSALFAAVYRKSAY